MRLTVVPSTMSCIVAVFAAVAVVGCGAGVDAPGAKRSAGGGPPPGEGEGEGEHPPVIPAGLTLRADPPIDTVPADGLGRFTIFADVVDANGTPLAGVSVAFTSSRGTIAPVATSDLTGVAISTVSATEEGQATIEAHAVGYADVTDSLVVEFAGCRTLEQAYTQELYPRVFSRCQGCHNEFGYGKSAYQLPFPGVDDWAQRSLDALTPYAGPIDVDALGNTLPELVAMPTDQAIDLPHGGGQVIAPDSPEAALLAAFAASVLSPGVCVDDVDRADDVLSRVALLPPRETFARAKFALTGEVATPEEIAAMPDTEQGLSDALDDVLGIGGGAPADGVLDRVVDIYGDDFLTDQFLQAFGGGRVLNRSGQMTRRFFFSNEGLGGTQCNPLVADCCSEFYSAETCAGKNNALIDTLAREPLLLLGDIVTRDAPMSEMLTLDHTLVSRLSAIFYGFSDAERTALFGDTTIDDTTTLVSAQLHRSTFNNIGFNANATWPHAGVLSTFGLLSRFPSTSSNKNRGRAASLAFQRFLHIDIMSFAEFSTLGIPVDAPLENATQTQPACLACHAAIDPVAGAFRHISNNATYTKVVNTQTSAFFVGLPETSFLGDAFDENSDGDPLQWLAGKLAAHERFPLAVLIPVLTHMTGFQELPNAVEESDDEAAAGMLAREIQRKILDRLRDRFATTHALHLRPLLKDVVLSELFRGDGATGSTLTDIEKRALELAGVGRGVFITPEQLDRKLRSVFGFPLSNNRNPVGINLLLTEAQFRILLGGINFEDVATRFRDASPVADRVIERMGNEIACVAVAHDFAVDDAGARHLFTNSSDETDTTEAHVRADLARLHQLLYGVTVATDGDDVNEAYALWAQVQADTSIDALAAGCQATKTYDADQTLLSGLAGHHAVTADPNRVVRAWIATLSFLLSDPRFFVE